METFSALLAICAGNSPVPGEFPAQRPVTRSFDVFFDLCLNKRLSKQSWGWWFETLSSPFWGHCNVAFFFSKQEPTINASEVLTILVYFRYAPTSSVTPHERSRVLFHRPFDCLFKGPSTPTKKHNQISTLLTLVLGIHRWPLKSPHKWPVMRVAFHVMTSLRIIFKGSDWAVNNGELAFSWRWRFMFLIEFTCSLVVVKTDLPLRNKHFPPTEYHSFNLCRAEFLKGNTKKEPGHQHQMRWYWFHFPFYNGYNFYSMLVLKLNHVNKVGAALYFMTGWKRHQRWFSK